MLKPFLLFSALLAGACTLPAQQPAAPVPATPPTPEFIIPPESAAMKNPVKPTAESRTRAKKFYGYDCAVCHGEDGAGAGDLAKNMKAKMPDFRDPSTLKSRSDGELFYIIQKGKGEMEGEGERLNPDQTWNLVNYIRTFAKLQAALAPAPVASRNATSGR